MRRTLAGSAACSSVARMRSATRSSTGSADDLAREAGDLPGLVVAAARLACRVQRHRHERIDRRRAALEQSVREDGAEDARDGDLAAVLQAMDQFDQRELVAERGERGVECRWRCKAQCTQAVARPLGAAIAHPATGGCISRQVVLAFAAQVERGRLAGIQAQQARGGKKPMNQRLGRAVNLP